LSAGKQWGGIFSFFVSIKICFESAPILNIPVSPITAATDSAKAELRGPSEEAAVRAIGLSKRFGTFDALADLHLSIPAGKVFGLLGPNGAGKTTFIRTLLGFLYPTGGRVLVMGLDPVVDPVGVRKLVSYLPGDARLPREMRGAGVLRFFADMQAQGDLKRSIGIAERLELDLKRFVGFMSTGMRQKLAIAAVMGSHAPILILDEPTANLDPTVRGDVLTMVEEAKAEGRTIIFSSHVLSEIEDICDRVAFLRRGRLALQQSLDSLKQRHRIVAKISNERSVEVPHEIGSLVESVTRRGDSVTIETASDLAPLLGWLQSLDLKQMRVEAFGLRAVYDSIHRGTENAETNVDQEKTNGLVSASRGEKAE
jgi:ABC-2 type transport system ATP-binding protein